MKLSNCKASCISAQINKPVHYIPGIYDMADICSIRAMECGRASILWLGSDGDILIKGRKGDFEEIEDLKLENRGFVTNYILNEGKPVLFPEKESEFSRRFVREFYDCWARGYNTDSFIAVPIRIRQEIVAIINVTDRLSGLPFTDKDLGELESISNKISSDLENFKLFKMIIEKERISKEIEIAHEIQSSFLPKISPKIDGLDISFMHRPAFEMGGDYFDFVRVSEHRHGICIGDVAGKGIPASLPFMILRTLFKKFANGYNDPRQLVSDINKSLIHDLSPGTFITFLYCIYDSVEQKFLISNAGHCYPLYYDSLTKTITQLDTSGFVLGVFPDIDYETICLDFKPNDILILATDGVFDVKGPGKTMWGDDNFIEVIKKNADKAPYEIIASVLNEINSFRNNEKQFDDMAMIVIKNNKQ